MFRPDCCPASLHSRKRGDSQLERVALSMDVRGCRTSEEIERALDKLDEQGKDYKIYFWMPRTMHHAPLQRDPPPLPHQHCRGHFHPGGLCKGTQNIEAFAGACRLRHQYRPAFYSTKQRTHLRSFCKNGGAKGAMRLTVMSFGIQIRQSRRRQTL